MYVQAFNTLKIPELRLGTLNRRYSEKDDLPEHLREFFLLLCHFHMNLNIQNSWPSWLSTYHWQFSTGNHFHVKRLTNPRVTSIIPTASISLCALRASLVDFISAIIFRSFHLNFLCTNLAEPITSYCLFSNFCCAHCMIHPENCSHVPSPVGFNSPIISQSPLLRFSCENPATPLAQDHLFSKF